MESNLIIGFILGILCVLLVVYAVYSWRRGRGVRKGKKGEKMVSKVLRGLKQRDNIILNDVLLPTQSHHSSQIDHIVVSTRGIFVIETKSISGRITGSEHSQYWTRHFASGSSRFYNPILQNLSHIRNLRRILPNVDADLFFSFIVFTEARGIDIKADDIIVERTILPDKHIQRTFLPSERKRSHWWSFRKEIRLDERIVIVPIEDLLEEITRRPRVIDREELETIASHIEGAALSGRSERHAHTKYARETSRNISREIRQGRCPRCGGSLIIRRTKTGEFAGCENYPSCRFTCSADLLK